MNFDTITAIATPPGIGAIATIRISGPKAIEVTSKLWQGRDLSTCHASSAHLGYITDLDGQPIDQVVATIFRAPASFTGLDTVEISCHGSLLIQQRIIDALCRAGARIAEPGEFTRQAFITGKIDLAQAEGIADLIAAQSDAARKIALNHTRGQFSEKIANLRERLIELASLFELELDFSEEDVEFADREKLRSLALQIKEDITSLTDSFRAGQVIKNGIPVVIAGAPNAGKSTLLNTILGHKRALVSDIPGTTRDTIEESISIDGIQLRLIDTAGIRLTADPIEKLGIDLTLSHLRQATETIWLIDPTTPLAPQLPPLTEHLSQNADTTTVILITKSDLTDPESTLTAIRQYLSRLLIDRLPDILPLSTLDREAAMQLLRTITTRAIASYQPDNTITNLRHYEALRSADAALNALLAGLPPASPRALFASSNFASSSPDSASPRTISASPSFDSASTTPLSFDEDLPLTPDLLAQHLREALHHLGLLTGAITTPDLLSTIFSRFCIGK